MPLLTISMSEVPAADAGLASGFGNVTMQIGAAIGLAALGTISTSHAQALVAQGHSDGRGLDQRLPGRIHACGRQRRGRPPGGASDAAATGGGDRRRELVRIGLDEAEAEAA